MAPMQQLLLCMSLLLSLTTTTIAQSPTLATTASTVAPSSGSLAPPSCAASCVEKASGSQSCAPSDQSCLCSASTQIQESITACLSTSTCSDTEKSAAIDYYPEYCASLNLAVGSGVPTAIATAGGNAPAKTEGSVVHNPTTTVHSSATETTTITPDGNTTHDSNNNQNLGLPAILGITLAAIIVVMGFAALMVWSILRRRYVRSHHGPRRDLGDEFMPSQPRPARSKSVESNFMVQPSPVEKEEFGRSLSRTSTLVPPPPVAKDDDKRSSEEKRNSARNKALKLLLGGNERLRASFMSGRSSTKRSSLVVPPLNISKTEEEELRISKF